MSCSQLQTLLTLLSVMAIYCHTGDRMFVNYREDIIKKFTYLYLQSDVFTNIDDYMIFYFDLYSHCDATFRILLRGRTATIFKAAADFS